MELSFEPFAQVASVNDQTQARLYYRRFVEAQFAVYGYGHMVFAAYAAVPALLTPDLAYKLWQNFSTYQWRAETKYIHRIAVSDVLLHLCEDLGQDLYEMPAGLKLALLDWLNKESQDENDLNLSSPQQIAQFVVDYHQNPTTGFQRYGSGYEDLQLWTAQHILDPEYAYNKVYEALRSKLDSLDEFLRLLELWDQLRLNGQALGYALTPDQENLAALKPSWKALIQEDGVALKQELQHLAGRSDLRQYLQPTKGAQLLGLSIPGRLQSVVQELVSSIEQESSVVIETEATDGPSVHGILIGVGRAEGREDWPVWDDVWAVQEYFAELCQNQGANWRPHVLIDSREGIPQKELSWVSVEQPLHYAQLANVQQVVKQILALPSHPQDVLVIYYKGIHHLRFIQLEDQILDLNDYLHLINRFSSFLLFEGFELDNELAMQPEVWQKPFAQFRATHATQQSLNQVIGGKKRAPFTHFFLEVLREGGFQRSYSEVFYRSEFLAHNLLPQLQCTPTYYNLDYKSVFFTGTLADAGFQYLLEYGGEGSWHLNAGKNRGITPSSDFMQTIVRAEDGREFIIGDVYENRALIKQKVEWLAETRPEAIPVTLLQTAISRMKIAFEPGMDVEARRELEEAIARHQIYYVEFVGNVDDARFFIRFLEGRRYALFNQLSSRRSLQAAEYPLFLPMEDSYLFIVQIEHIAKWYGVLEYDNLRGALPKESIGWEVSTFTATKAQLQHSPLQIVLHYENGQKPSFSCKVVNRSAQALFISCIYLDASFEITNAPLHPERIESGQEVWLFEKQMDTRAPEIGIPEVVEHFKKVEDVTEFIKFFVSEQYFTPEAFEQSAIEEENLNMRGVNFERSNVFRGFEGGDWTSVVVPINVFRNRSGILQPSINIDEVDVYLQLTESGRIRYESYLKAKNILTRQLSTKFNLLDTKSNSKHGISIDKELVEIYDLERNFLIKRILGSEDDLIFDEAIGILEKITKWEGFFGLKNDKTQFNTESFKITFKNSNSGGFLSKGVFRSAKQNEEIINVILKDGENNKMRVSLDVELENKTGGTLYFQAYYLSLDYNITSLMGDYFTISEVPPMERLFLSDVMEFEVDNTKKESIEILKFIIRTVKDNEDFLWEQDALEGIGGDVQFNPNAKSLSSSEYLRRKSDNDKLSLTAPNNDWFCKTIILRLIKYEGKIGTNVLSLMQGKILIKSHSSFQAEIGLSRIENSIYDTMELSEIADRFGWYRFLSFENKPIDPSQKGSGPNALDFFNILNGNDLRNKPLVLEFDIASKINEYFLPITFDGEDFIPLGDAFMNESNKLESRLYFLPDVYSSLWPYKQKLDSAKICFLSLLPKGERTTALYWVEYNHDNIVYHPSDILKKVNSAKNILLLVHGLVGSPVSMAQSLRKSIIENNVDLILVFEYDSIQTTIVGVAEILKQNLQEAGINTQGKGKFDKKITIVAHSLGGIISRYFIEKLGGNSVINQLILVGTPTNTFNLGELHKDKHYALLILGLAIKSSLDVNSLIILLSLINNDSYTSSKLQQLKEINTSLATSLNISQTFIDTSYRVILGDIQKYARSEDKILEFFEKFNFKVDRLNSDDLLVSEKSAKNLISEGNDVSMKRFGCHHFNYFENQEVIDHILNLLPYKNPL